MKLRIKGNSLRIRMTQSEVGWINLGKSVAEVIHFAPGSELRYKVQSSPVESAIGVQFNGSEICVMVPEALSISWAGGDAVSLRAEQSLGTGEKLDILIEKDFFCLKTRAHQTEDESDMFPNPNAAHGRCYALT